MRSVFNNLSFISLWTRSSFFTMASQLFEIGSYYYLAVTYKSISISALVFLISAIPSFIVSFFSGCLVDKINKKYILLISDLSILLISFILTIGLNLINTHYYPVVMIVFIHVILDLANQFTRPAIFALIPIVVKKEQLMSSNGFMRTSEKTVSIIGSAFGAAIYSLLNFNGVMMSFTLLLLFSTVSICFIKAGPLLYSKKETPDLFKMLIEGYRYVTDNIFILVFILFKNLVNFFFLPISIVLPFFVRNELHSGIHSFASIMISLSVGAIIGHHLSGYINKKNHWIVFLSAFFMGAALMGLSISHSTDTAILFMFICGLFNGIFSIYAMTANQCIISSQYRGRVSSFSSLLSALLTAISILMTQFMNSYLAISNRDILLYCSSAIMITVFFFLCLSSFRKFIGSVLED